MDDPREQAWSNLLEVLPPTWRTGRPTNDPARQQWQIVAIGPKHRERHGPPPESVEGPGVDEVAAVRDLVERLRQR